MFSGRPIDLKEAYRRLEEETNTITKLMKESGWCGKLKSRIDQTGRVEYEIILEREVKP